ncbi:EF-hand domain-containing protein [Bdellovibrio sp. NC01]|uniref:EF-hand domain-containing protein n=1 Tax=Bdellovibrio sp. NC01 TaxID=2220073 RepID=UPI0011597E05|nr:EF-hand domain-containing protein [Bdellovibrio sp. NC01]QDK38085.1 EF-hand domain-containing protein [Bdellovibrio sp. NC01]
MGTVYLRRALSAALVFSGSLAFAQTRSFPMSVNTATSGESVVSAPASGLVTRSGNATMQVKIVNSCFGTNLRGVTNPVAPSSEIYADFDLVVGSKSYHIGVWYPAIIISALGFNPSSVNPISAEKLNIPAGGNAAIYGNTVVINSPFPSKVSVDAAGNIVDADPGAVYVNPATVSFTQKVSTCDGSAYGAYGVSSYVPAKACGDYMGKNGPISATLGQVNVASDKSSVEINVSFPGQTGFCGGYYSPLMVFFDDARPAFSNITDFPLNKFAKTSWPEANHVGYFLALDDGSGKITKKDQLFGNDEKYKNGFEALKALDSNHDGVIDKRDKAFKNLVLWSDKNGDGVSQPNELVKLSSKVVKISLNYKDDRIVAQGMYAEEREYADFWYKDAKGKLKKGDIVDVWLSPRNVQLSQK